MALFEIRNVTRRFGGLVAVDNVSFTVEPGEIVGLIGPNGAGKTTVFNLVTGVYALTGGEIRFAGARISGLPPRQIVQMGIARTYQNIRLFGNLRVIENALAGCHLKTRYVFRDALFRTSKFRSVELEVHEEAARVLRSAGLGGYFSSYAGDLPHALQRKLEIARAILTGARFLLLDEPAAGMNPLESGELLTFIKKLKHDGFTILMIDHDMDVVMKISDRVCVMDYGRLIAEGKPDDVVQNPDVVRAYLGDADGDSGMVGQHA